jgi:D-alanyl-D-alanine dipeptidase
MPTPPIKPTLGQLRREFTRNIAALITYGFSRGYSLSIGEAYRTAEQQAIYMKAGKSKVATSQHMKGLAVDLNLFIDGKLINDSTHDAYRDLGKKWDDMHPANRWGGDWDGDGDQTDQTFFDGVHFEMVG